MRRPEELPSQEDTLLLTRRYFEVDGPFSDAVVSSLIEAKARLIEHPEFEGTGAFVYHSQSPTHRRLMQEAFEKEMVVLSNHTPVIRFDVERMALQKEQQDPGQAISQGELWRTLYEAVARYTPGQNGVMSIDKLSEVSGERSISDRLTTIQHTVSQLGVAVVYGDTKAVGEDSRALDGFIATLVEPPISFHSTIQRVLVIIADADMERANRSFASPWVGKIDFAQLTSLDPQDVMVLIKKAYRALSPDKTSVRSLVSPFGSGKTTMLRMLQEKLDEDHIAGVGFANAMRPEELEEFIKQNHQLLFVDEAALLSPHDVDRIIVKLRQSKTTGIFLYPSEEAKQDSIRQAETPVIR